MAVRKKLVTSSLNVVTLGCSKNLVDSEVLLNQLSMDGFEVVHDSNDTDSDIVDRWWVQVCRNTALEVYEQSQADPELRDLRKMNTKDLGNGRTEVS